MWSTVILLRHEIFVQADYLKGKDTVSIAYQKQTKSPIALYPFSRVETKF